MGNPKIPKNYLGTTVRDVQISLITNLSLPTREDLKATQATGTILGVEN